MSSDYRSQAYGLIWESDLPLAQFDLADNANNANVRVRRVGALENRPLITPVNAGTLHADGTRFTWQDEAVFDMFGGRRVDYVPGPHWTCDMPHSFFGTVVAHILAWRGAIPIHGSAVAIDGRAVLIIGQAGAGKSSLTAGLIAQGARLVSDDLSALWAGDDRGQARVWSGRTTIRLGSQVAQWLDGEPMHMPISETRGKSVLRPDLHQPNTPIPLGAIIALGEHKGRLPPQAAHQLLMRHLFRPKWMQAMPGHDQRLRDTLALAFRVPVLGFPPVNGGGHAEHIDRARAAYAAVQSAPGQDLPRHQMMNSPNIAEI